MIKSKCPPAAPHAPCAPLASRLPSFFSLPCFSHWVGFPESPGQKHSYLRAFATVVPLTSRNVLSARSPYPLLSCHSSELSQPHGWSWSSPADTLPHTPDGGFSQHTEQDGFWNHLVHRSVMHCHLSPCTGHRPTQASLSECSVPSGATRGPGSSQVFLKGWEEGKEGVREAPGERS